MTSSNVFAILSQIGPSRSSQVVLALQSSLGISPEAARQRTSRISKPIYKFPVPLLPNREAFLYLDTQRNTEAFWINLINALRETKSIYGHCLDGLLCRGGIVPASEFDVISGAPLALKRQVGSNRVLATLIASGALERVRIDGENFIKLARHEIGDVSGQFQTRLIVEKILLDGVREWAKKLGLASFHKIGIRGDPDDKRTIGSFKWDLAAPSYLVSLRQNDKPGWLIADVCMGETLEENNINYFIRKVQLLQASQKNARIFPILIADSFTGKALTKGHNVGIVLATPENLFGQAIARALDNLLSTLANAAAIVSGNPDRLVKLVEQLSTFEGTAGNLRGVLFELICAHLAKVQGGSIDFSVNARDPETGVVYDIDVLRIVSKGQCVSIECKAKNPGGQVGIEDVEEWLSKLPKFINYLKSETRFSDARLSFELWTTGIFSEEALSKLESEKIKRKKRPISWKTGEEVFQISKNAKEKKINDTLREHFFKHPLA